jgi:hypothetical protein
MYIEQVKLPDKTGKWWKSMNRRDRRMRSNRTTYPGVWEHHPGYFVWQVQVNGKRYREGGYRTGEEAAMARQSFIIFHGLPHTRPLKDEHYRYLMDTFGRPRPRKAEINR